MDFTTPGLICQTKSDAVYNPDSHGIGSSLALDHTLTHKHVHPCILSPSLLSRQFSFWNVYYLSFSNCHILYQINAHTPHVIVTYVIYMISGKIPRIYHFFAFTTNYLHLLLFVHLNYFKLISENWYFVPLIIKKKIHVIFLIGYFVELIT